MTTFPTAPSKEALEHGETLAPRFDASGLIAAVATHADTGEVLMLAWMNAEALEQTIATGEAHYFSRSRGLRDDEVSASTGSRSPGTVAAASGRS